MMPELEIQYLCERLGDDPTPEEQEMVKARIVDYLSDGAQYTKEQVRDIVHREAHEHPFAEWWPRCYTLLPEILGE